MQPGFLTSENRMNVLLTRCRKGMIIVSSSRFIAELGGVKTVLGKMHKHWKSAYNATWVDWRHVSSGVAGLPGGLGPKRTAAIQVTPSNPSPKTTHRRPYAEFNVASSLYHSPPYTQHSLWIYPINREVLGRGTGVEGGHIITSSVPVLPRPPPDITCSIDFPPLVVTVTKTPILPGTWRHLQVKQTAVEQVNTLSKYSLVGKKRAPSTNLGYSGEKHPQRMSVSSALVSGSLSAAPVQNILTKTIVYRRGK